jgi:SAM-dependent methyltransferase
MGDQVRPTPKYPLGYSESEHRRLITQSRFYGDLTERVFRLAGLQPGMSVLDVGCGASDVSFLAAALVGPTGNVLGVDRATESIALAQQRARVAGLEQVAFQEGELATLELDRPFDALVGRLVLMYLPDPAATLGYLLRFVRPGGLVIFQEMEMSMARSVPPVPLFQTCRDWICETFRRAGFETDMGLRLFPTFPGAGLDRPEMTLDGQVEGGMGSPAYEIMAQTVRRLLPLMEPLGVATAIAVQVDTLSSRLEAEVISRGSAPGPGSLGKPPKKLVALGHRVVLHARNPKWAGEALTQMPRTEEALVGDLARLEEVRLFR